MARSKGGSGTEGKKGSILAVIGRTGERATEVALKAGATGKDLAQAAGISLRSGEILEREGEVIELTAPINDGDVVFVTEDDDNGAA